MALFVKRFNKVEVWKEGLWIKRPRQRKRVPSRSLNQGKRGPKGKGSVALSVVE
jgi:hypothetical protein